MAFDVVVIGSANLDLVAQLEHLPKPGQTLLASGYAEHAGGKGLNQAVACARMGAKTAFVGCVGDDDAGRFLRSVLDREGVDTSQLLSVTEPTGRAFINVDKHGENEIVVILAANGLVGVSDGIRGADLVLPPCKVVVAQLEIPQATISEVFGQARKFGATTVLNPAPAMKISREILAATDIIVPNETEAQSLGGVDELLRSGIKNIVITRGENGAEMITTRDSVVSSESFAPYRVTPIDTVGAGDAFIGAMCAELSRGVALSDACRMAVVAGALATTRRGAVPSLPLRADVLEARNKTQIGPVN